MNLKRVCDEEGQGACRPLDQRLIHIVELYRAFEYAFSLNGFSSMPMINFLFNSNRTLSDFSLFFFVKHFECAIAATVISRIV